MDDLRHLPNERCSTAAHPWSVLDISLTGAQLAGILAGFTLLALTTMLMIKHDDSALFQFAVKHAVQLLGLGTVILGINAYLFGSVAAIRPPVMPDPPAFPEVQPATAAADQWKDLFEEWLKTPEMTQWMTDARRACSMAWLQFLPSAGFLALGAVSLVAGLTWIIIGYSKTEEALKVAGQANVAILCVSAAITVLLAFDVIYFGAVMSEFSKDFERASDSGLPIAIFAWVVTWALLFYAWRVKRAEIALAMKKLGTLKGTHEEWPTQDANKRRGHIEGTSSSREDSVSKRVATTGQLLLGYLLAAVMVTLGVNHIPETGFRELWSAFAFWFLFIICLSPLAINYFIASSSPGFNTKEFPLATVGQTANEQSGAPLTGIQNSFQPSTEDRSECGYNRTLYWPTPSYSLRIEWFHRKKAIRKKQKQSRSD